MISEEIIKKIKPGARIKIYEGTAPFEGLVIARKHGNEPGATFTLRSVLSGVGVEKVIPLRSPALTKVEVMSSPRKPHRAKLYFVRNISSKKIRKRLKTGV